MRELQLDGVVGPTHNYGGLSPGNVASTQHAGQTSSPKQAALEGLAKMRFVAKLGVLQGVLPPHERPSLRVLRRMGFEGSDEAVIAAAGRGDAFPLRLASSASAMWTANAATVAPSADTADRRVHLTPANLQAMFHRSIEPPTTLRVLRAIFSDPARFAVHEPLPGGGQLADEGAANHMRLQTSRGSLHLFAWGRRAWGTFRGPARFPARQTIEASQAIARAHRLEPARVRFVQQLPAGIDAGAFHTDVLAVANERFLMLHAYAFQDQSAVLSDMRSALGEELTVVEATPGELPIDSAVAAYPFNSQVLTLQDGSMVIVAPVDARDDPFAHRFLRRVVEAPNPVKAVHYLDVRQSMHNGGGPACLRLRVPLEDVEVNAMSGRVLLDDALHDELVSWVERSYRDRLVPADLADPKLVRETMTALDELTGILKLGSVYDFQQV